MFSNTRRQVKRFPLSLASTSFTLTIMHFFRLFLTIAFLLPLRASLAEEASPSREHWAFIPPEQAPEPKVRDGWTACNPIDSFILSRLEREGLEPSPEADRYTLVRRLTLDLTGLPPTIAEVDAFVEDSSPHAYEKLVERLLASSRYGEHQARYWLDAARYGDTHGLHMDNERSLWPYRDWVVSAFNRNLPFDQFTIEQLAGDLLAGRDARAAHRPPASTAATCRPAKEVLSTRNSWCATRSIVSRRPPRSGWV